MEFRAPDFCACFGLGGTDNTASGMNALYSNFGNNNTADGFAALYTNYSGANNTAAGMDALYYNVASNNTADGYAALYENTNGTNDTATGMNALYNNTTGTGNTGVGVNAGFSNVTGANNTAVGFQALLGASGQSNFNNTAIGANALQANTTGVNTALGQGALIKNTTGTGNTGIGQGTLRNNITGNGNIALGSGAGGNVTHGGNIDIGHPGMPTDQGVVRLGGPPQNATYIAGISGAGVMAGAVSVLVDGTGKLGTFVMSSARFKEAIAPMAKVSEEILSLEPVTFRYKQELDPTKTPQFGLVAEQVEKVDPNLVVRDPQGKPYTVRYDAVNAMLLNEFLKEHRKVEAQATKAKAQDAAISELKQQIQTLTASLKGQAAQIQKVSAHMVLNNGATTPIAVKE